MFDSPRSQDSVNKEDLNLSISEIVWTNVRLSRLFCFIPLVAFGGHPKVTLLKWIRTLTGEVFLVVKLS